MPSRSSHPLSNFMGAKLHYLHSTPPTCLLCCHPALFDLTVFDGEEIKRKDLHIPFHSIPKCWSCGCTSLIGVIDTHLIMGTAKGPWTNKRIEWRQRLTTNNEIILLLPTILRNRCEWHQIAARDQSGNQSPERNEIHVRTREGLYPSHCSVE